MFCFSNTVFQSSGWLEGQLLRKLGGYRGPSATDATSSGFNALFMKVHSKHGRNYLVNVTYTIFAVVRISLLLQTGSRQILYSFSRPTVYRIR